MTTFDKLKGAAATLADAAVKTTGDLAQKGKKQMDLLALENKLSRAQRQLGALVYALHKNGEENTALVERYRDHRGCRKGYCGAGACASSRHGRRCTDGCLLPQCGAEVDPHAIFVLGAGQTVTGRKCALR